MILGRLRYQIGLHLWHLQALITIVQNLLDYDIRDWSFTIILLRLFQLWRIEFELCGQLAGQLEVLKLEHDSLSILQDSNSSHGVFRTTDINQQDLIDYEIDSSVVFFSYL